jgi:hypothetical protein
MTTIVLANEMQALTGGIGELEIEATAYRDAIAVLQQRFPGLTAKVFTRFSIAIDGSIVHNPLLEKFAPDSEVVFIPKIASG